MFELTPKPKNTQTTKDLNRSCKLRIDVNGWKKKGVSGEIDHKSYHKPVPE